MKKKNRLVQTTTSALKRRCMQGNGNYSLKILLRELNFCEGVRDIREMISDKALSVITIPKRNIEKERERLSNQQNHFPSDAQLPQLQQQ